VTEIPKKRQLAEMQNTKSTKKPKTEPVKQGKLPFGNKPEEPEPPKLSVT
jgi:hypothetical protein